MNQQYHTPIDDLLVKYLLREATPEEKQVVETWLNASPDNRHYYEQLQLIWDKSIHLTPSPLIESEGEEEKAWQTLRKKLNKPARPRPVIPLPWAMAAAAAILLPILFFTFFGWPGGNQPLQTLSSNNRIVRDTLPDGTLVTLNIHSTLTHPKKFNHRNVQLQGEAFFQVAADKAHPFQLAANGVTVTVLGTAFNVLTDSMTTQISVESGRVRVANSNGAIEIGAGESITLGSTDRQLQKHASPILIHHYYQPRVFVCNETPLGQLTEALQNAYGVPIVIEDGALSKQPVSVTFRDERLDRILSILTQTLKITSTKRGDSILLKK
ncbi:MAG TPA: FecR domain-containing protein [Puia sp.]|uniref:FecR domain-containing protein n=1 Tax=Puia sp. TaxID=2045100 RepID=UPI002BF0573B|nr:FecR domain-containing protein [Puia sp.]HVU95803.1 FecR domain-containing protein [Puia sp.]